MMNLCRYELQAADHQKIKLPVDSEIIDVSIDRGVISLLYVTPNLWGQPGFEQEMEERSIFMTRVSGLIPFEYRKYIGCVTIQFLTLYIFEVMG